MSYKKKKQPNRRFLKQRIKEENKLRKKLQKESEAETKERIKKINKEIFDVYDSDSPSKLKRIRTNYLFDKKRFLLAALTKY